MASRNLSPDQKAELRYIQRKIASDLREEGMDQAEIGAALGMAQPTVHEWPASNIGTDKACNDNRVKVPKDYQADILDRSEDGEPQEQIAADYGVSRQRVSQICAAERRRRQRAAELGQQATSAIYPLLTKAAHGAEQSFDLTRTTQHDEGLLMEAMATKTSESTAAHKGEGRSSVRDFVVAARKSPEEGVAEGGGEITLFLRRAAANSIGELDKLIGELQEARNYLQSESERIQREAARYAQLSETASASAKVISESLVQWRQANPPVRA